MIVYLSCDSYGPCEQSLRKPLWKLTCIGQDRFTWAGQRKAVCSCTCTASLQKLKGTKKRVETPCVHFQWIVSFWFLLGKKREKNEEKLLDDWEYMKTIYAKSLYYRISLQLSHMCPSITSYLGWNQFLMNFQCFIVVIW